MNDGLIAGYTLIGIVHFLFSLIVCSTQKQPIAARWCIVPVVSVLWPLFTIRMMWNGYDEYLSKYMPE